MQLKLKRVQRDDAHPGQTYLEFSSSLEAGPVMTSEYIAMTGWWKDEDAAPYDFRVGGVYEVGFTAVGPAE